MSVLKILKCRENAIIPKRATKGSAGYDLYACIDEPVTIYPNKSVVIPSGIKIELPENTAGLIYTRSGLGIKHGIHVTNGVGVIDWDYRGEIAIGLHNLSNKKYVIDVGERVAQLVITPVLCPQIVECDELSVTVRNEGKMGSTGKTN